MNCPACAGTGVCDACSGYGYFPASPESETDRVECVVCDGGTECPDCTPTDNSNHDENALPGVLEMSHR